MPPPAGHEPRATPAAVASDASKEARRTVSPIVIRRTELPRLHRNIAALEEHGCRCTVITPDAMLGDELSLSNTVRTALIAAEHGFAPEITLRGETTHVAAAAIRSLAERGQFVGAGTVLTAEQASEVLRAGARFLVSPGITPDTRRVIQLCMDAGALPIIGVGAWHEARALAHALRNTPVKYAKLFPAFADSIPTWKVMVMSPFPARLHSDLNALRLNGTARRPATFGAAMMIGSGALQDQPLRFQPTRSNFAWAAKAHRDFGLHFIATGGVNPSNIPYLLGRPGIAGFGASGRPDPDTAPAAFAALLNAAKATKPDAVLQNAPCIHLTNGPDGFPLASDRNLVVGLKYPCTALDNVRPAHLTKDFHRPPLNEVHVLTVTEGTITIRYPTADGERTFSIGDGCPTRSCVFEDHPGEGVKSDGHSSIAGPRGARAVIRIYPVGADILTPAS